MQFALRTTDAAPDLAAMEQALAELDPAVLLDFDEAGRTVRISTSAAKSSGSSRVTEPFTVLYSRSSPAGTSAIRARMLPFTDEACTGPPLETALTCPFTERATTSAVAPRTSSSPRA